MRLGYRRSYLVQASKGRLGVMAMLLDHGASLSAKDSMGNSALHRAASAGKVGPHYLSPVGRHKLLKRTSARIGHMVFD